MSNASTSGRGRLPVVGLVAAWMLAVAVAWALNGSWMSSAGGSGPAPGSWPEAASLPRRADRWELVVFAHPRCPCTLATLAEVERIASRGRDRLEVEVLFPAPAGAPEAWERGKLWDRAAAIPGVVVRADRGGVEARRFGAATSGQALLYDPEGVLRFRGGLTAGRGHEGDSPGKAAVLSLVLQGEADSAEAPVYGCPLFTPVPPPPR